VRDQVSHPYTTNKIMVPYVLSSCSQKDITQERKRLWAKRWQGFPEYKFFRHAIPIFYCRSQLFELGHLFKGFISCLYVAMLATIRSVQDRTRTPSHCQCYKYFDLIQPHNQRLDLCYESPKDPNNSVHAAQSVPVYFVLTQLNATLLCISKSL
jgi:hypothetical protein